MWFLQRALARATFCCLRGVTIDDGEKKPTIYKLYNFTNANTDVMEYRRDGVVVRESASQSVDLGFIP